ncbi:MAG: cytochrome C oxidase subunit IV family protein [Rhizobacter sp.]|nr:cytochrome C oxidase subunit IV family protein [Chlorobiales bacterium]
MALPTVSSTPHRAAAHTDSHSNGHGEAHVHITPLWVYLAIGGTLLALTAITVGVAGINFGGGWNLVIAMIVATVKASLVAFYFMHLKYDKKIYTIFFFSAILFLAIFIVFTMFDTLNRGAIYEQKAKEGAAVTDPKMKSFYDRLKQNPTSSRTGGHANKADHNQQGQPAQQGKQVDPASTTVPANKPH